MNRACTALAAASSVLLLAGAAGAAGGVGHLRCDYLDNPLGLDSSSPRLSWQVASDARGWVQAAYRVLVATSAEKLAAGEGDAWDSGRVESDRSIQVAYAGKPLAAGQRYHWKATVWGADGKPLDSEPAFWEMGLLSPEQWEAKWITLSDAPPPPPPTGAGQPPLGNWIWSAKGGNNATCLLRTSFEVPAGKPVAAAVLNLAVDNRGVVYLNGKKVGQHADWNSLARIDLAKAIQPGRNVLAIEAANQGGPCGLVAGLQVTFEDDTKVTVVSGEKWKAADKAAEGWQGADFDDSAWPAAKVVGRYGDAPWGAAGQAAAPLAPNRRSLCFRKQFTLAAAPARARVYVTGLGLYELHVNGRKVGDDVFTPGWTDYGKRIQYQTYDVTDLLRKGENVVAAVTGSGWWNRMNGSGANRPRLIAQLVVQAADGQTVRVVTDAAWKGHVSPVLADSFYHGETYDARLEMPGWDAPGFDEKDWPNASILPDRVDRFVAQQGPPIRVTAELKATKVTQPKPGVFVFDFGQNAAGRCRLKVRDAAPGTRITLRHAEELNADGTIYTANYRGARATDVYICRGGAEETWEPAFTYRGFRYAELTGYPGEPGADALASRVLHSAAPPAGTFACSNDLINRFWRNITWGQRSNMHSVPTDCPQRDERLGWTGDAQIFARTACWNMDMARFWNKWATDIFIGSGGGVVQGGGPGWDDATVVIPYTAWLFYDDTRLLEQGYDAMVRYVERRRAAAKGDLFEAGGYGDWIAVDRSTPKGLIGSAYYYHSVDLLARMAEAIGKVEDAKKYHELAGRIAAAFDAKYRDKQQNVYPSGSQTSFAIPLDFGLAPASARQAVADNLVKAVEARGCHPTTGFLGTPCLLPALASAGRHEVAYRLAAQNTYPSWGYMVKAGATTVWELWNSDKAGPGMNSRNHFALGSVGQWYFESLAGLAPDPAAPGFKHVLIAPHPAGDLTFARVEYPSMFGPIRCGWKIAGGQLSLDVSIPPNASATVRVPTPEPAKAAEVGRPADQAQGVKRLAAEPGAAVFEIGSGDYQFTAPAPRSADR